MSAADDDPADVEISDIDVSGLEQDAVAAYAEPVRESIQELGDGDNPAWVVADVDDTFLDRIRTADSLERKEESDALTHVLIQSSKKLAVDHEDLSISVVLSNYITYINDNLGDWAKKSQTAKDEIEGTLVPQLQAAMKNASEVNLGDSEPAEVQSAKDKILEGFVDEDDERIGLDEYIEEHVCEVRKKHTTDHTNDASTVVVFEDGDVVIDSAEADGNVFLNQGGLFAELQKETDKSIRPDLVSELAAAAIDGNIKKEKLWVYKKASLGPEERPWHSEMWNKCMEHLLKESEYRENTEPVPGPRTDVIDAVMDTVGSQNASRDKQNAADEGAVYVDESDDVLWVPYQMVDAEVENVAATREDVVSELDHRDMVSSELSGRKVSKRIGDDRYWLLDMSHPRVQEPAAIVDELRTGTDAMLDLDDDTSGGVSAAADGGSAVFGRDPDDDDDDQQHGTTDDVSNNGGDDE